MTSALACVGLAVSDETGLDWLVTRAHRAAREIGVFGGVHVGRWQDDSGATLILGWRSGELLDFLPAYTATSGGLLAGCHLINDSVASAAVVDADGRQLTAMAFDAKQYRQLRSRLSARSGPAETRSSPPPQRDGSLTSSPRCYPTRTGNTTPSLASSPTGTKQCSPRPQPDDPTATSATSTRPRLRSWRRGDWTIGPIAGSGGVQQETNLAGPAAGRVRLSVPRLLVFFPELAVVS